jgi:hypothetical protein
VPEDLRYDLGVYAIRQEQRRAGVPEVVEAAVRNFSLAELASALTPANRLL